MGLQEVILVIIFAAAIFYIARMVYRNLTAKKGCGTSCKCGVDFSDLKIPEQKP